MKTPRFLSKFTAALVIHVAIATSDAATVTFTDSTFSPGDWSATKIVDTTAGASATFTVGQVVTGGNPAEYREVGHTFGVGGLRVAHLADTMSQSFTYNPSTHGAIDALDSSYDVRHFTDNGFYAVGYSPLIFQGGNYYQIFRDAVVLDSWISYSHTGLTAADFQRVQPGSLLSDPNSHPDFSSTGGPMVFGFLSLNSVTAGGALSLSTGIDNYSLTLHTVPEPSSALLGFGALGLLARRRR